MFLMQLSLFIGIGAHWWNIAHPGTTLDGTSLLHIILMLIFDTVFFTCMAMYFENVLPSKYGIRKPWYYPLMVGSTIKYLKSGEQL